MMRGSRDSLPHRAGQLGWDPDPVTQDNPRHGLPVGYRPFEERPALRPFGLTRIPLDNSYPATRIIIVGNNTGHVIRPRIPQYSQQLMPRYVSPQETMHVGSESNGSKLTKEEQEMVLKKLKKEIYNPMPKILARRVSLYYRDLNKDPNSKSKEKQTDEDRKGCAVCLEDFEVREEVMVTPCNHMFHEECIVPWVKNHGQCPVCRASFYERRQTSPCLNNDRAMFQPGSQPALFSDELHSLIQAMDEVFPWGI